MESDYKTCTACSVSKPISEFSIRTDRGTLRTKCKRCVSDRTGPYSKMYYAEKHKDLEWRANRSRTVAAQAQSKREKFLSDFMVNPESRMALYLMLKARNEKEKARLTRKRIKYWAKKKQFDPEFVTKHYADGKPRIAAWRKEQRALEVKEWSKSITDPKFRMALLICALNRNKSLKRPFNHRSGQQVATLRAALRRKNDPAFRLAHDLRNIVRKAIRAAKTKARDRFISKLECSGADFVKHIESQWDETMSWANYGNGKELWSIDHARPLASVDILDPEQQSIVLHYANLRPMWHTDNLKKQSYWGGRMWLYADHRKENTINA